MVITSKLISTSVLEHVERVWTSTKDISPIYQLLLPDVAIIEAIRGHVRAHLHLTANHVNSRGSIHGAVSAALVDWAGTMAIATYGFEKSGASLDIHVTYVSTAMIGDTLEIAGTVNKVGNTIAFPSVTIEKLGEGQPSCMVATGSHTKFLPASKENR